LTAGEPLGDEWTEVLDVVRHHRAEFVGCGLKKGPVAEADEVRAVRDRVRSIEKLDQWVGVVSQPLFEVALGKGAFGKTNTVCPLTDPLAHSWRRSQRVVLGHRFNRAAACHAVTCDFALAQAAGVGCNLFETKLDVCCLKGDGAAGHRRVDVVTR